MQPAVTRWTEAGIYAGISFSLALVAVGTEPEATLSSLRDCHSPYERASLARPPIVLQLAPRIWARDQAGLIAKATIETTPQTEPSLDTN
jgi:hypothetical protein